MFPIADLKGRIIAFGGRALDARCAGQVSQLARDAALSQGARSSSTRHRARGPRTTKDRVVVVEGYMDVVALAEAGFDDAVAPLGTALTRRPDASCSGAWRTSRSSASTATAPAARRRFRAVETALPLLKPGLSLSVCVPARWSRSRRSRAPARARTRCVRCSAVRGRSPCSGSANGPVGDWSTPERRAVEAAPQCPGRRIGDGRPEPITASHLRATLTGRTWARPHGPGRGGGSAGGGGQGGAAIAPGLAQRSRARLGPTAQRAPQRRTNASRVWQAPRRKRYLTTQRGITAQNPAQSPVADRRRSRDNPDL